MDSRRYIDYSAGRRGRQVQLRSTCERSTWEQRLPPTLVNSPPSQGHPSPMTPVWQRVHCCRQSLSTRTSVLGKDVAGAGATAAGHTFRGGISRRQTRTAWKVHGQGSGDQRRAGRAGVTNSGNERMNSRSVRNCPSTPGCNSREQKEAAPGALVILDVFVASPD